MYPYMNEDAAFERLKDMQREVENSRLMAAALPGLGSLVRELVVRAWRVGMLATRRSARRRPTSAHDACDEAAAPDAA